MAMIESIIAINFRNSDEHHAQQMKKGSPNYWHEILQTKTQAGIPSIHIKNTIT
jgi:hypothetical protein